MLVAVFVFVLAVYGYSKSESQGNIQEESSRNINEPMTINTTRTITDTNLVPTQTVQFEVNDRVQSPKPNYHHRQIQRAESRIYNPLEAPARADPYQFGVPVNIPTRGMVSSYQQVGALYSETNSGKPQILPLFGKPIHPGASKWLYYTSTSDFQSVKIPIHRNGRKCQGDFGCEELYEGDQVNVHPYRCKFKVSLYDLEKPRYLPYV
jgi:hypothetical protein